MCAWRLAGLLPSSNSSLQGRRRGSFRHSWVIWHEAVHASEPVGVVLRYNRWE